MPRKRINRAQIKKLTFTVYAKNIIVKLIVAVQYVVKIFTMTFKNNVILL